MYKIHPNIHIDFLEAKLNMLAGSVVTILEGGGYYWHIVERVSDDNTKSVGAPIESSGESSKATSVCVPIRSRTRKNKNNN